MRLPSGYTSTVVTAYFQYVGKNQYKEVQSGPGYSNSIPSSSYYSKKRQLLLLSKCNLNRYGFSCRSWDLIQDVKKVDHED